MADLRAHALTYCRPPRYPTKLQVAALPDLLARHQPAAWVRKREIAGAAAALLSANLTARSLAQDLPPPTPAAQVAVSQPAARARLAGDAPAIVAPVFLHGEGRGATGCIVVSPPAFLSEEEALQVIREQLNAAGVELTQFNVEFKAVEIPQRSTKWPGQSDRGVGDFHRHPRHDELCQLTGRPGLRDFPRSGRAGVFRRLVPDAVGGQ